MKKNKIFVSGLLVFLFFVPMTVKFADVLVHRHEHFYCNAQNQKHYHSFHKKCPIPDFNLSLFFKIKKIQITQKYFFNTIIIKAYKFICFHNNSKYSFLLRAPPFLQ